MKAGAQGVHTHWRPFSSSNKLLTVLQPPGLCRQPAPTSSLMPPTTSTLQLLHSVNSTSSCWSHFSSHKKLSRAAIKTPQTGEGEGVEGGGSGVGKVVEGGQTRRRAAGAISPPHSLLLQLCSWLSWKLFTAHHRSEVGWGAGPQLYHPGLLATYQEAAGAIPDRPN